jgi:hypothetical protein
MAHVLTSEQWQESFLALQQALSRRFGVPQTPELVRLYIRAVMEEYASATGLDIQTFAVDLVELLPTIINQRLEPGYITRQISVVDDQGVSRLGDPALSRAIGAAVRFKDELDTVILDALVPPRDDLTGASQTDLLSAAAQSGYLTGQSSPAYLDYLTTELLPQLRQQWETQQALQGPERVGEFRQWALEVLQLQRAYRILKRPTIGLDEAEFNERESKQALSDSDFLGPIVDAGILRPGETGPFFDYLKDQVLPQIKAQMETVNAGLQARGEDPLTIAEFTQGFLAERPDLFSREAPGELGRTEAIGSAFRRSTDFRRDVGLGLGPPQLSSLLDLQRTALDLQRTAEEERVSVAAMPTRKETAGDVFERALRREEAESGEEVGGLEPLRPGFTSEQVPTLRGLTARESLGFGQNAAVKDLQQRQQELIRGLPGDLETFEGQLKHDTEILKAVRSASGGGAFGRFLLGQLPGLQSDFAKELRDLGASSEDKQRAFENLEGQGLTQQEQAAAASFLTQPRGRKFGAFLKERTEGLREAFDFTPAGEAESERVRVEEETKAERIKGRSLRAGGTTVFVGGR